MNRITIRISKETHAQLVTEARRHPTDKCVSALARSMIERALGHTEEESLGADIARLANTIDGLVRQLDGMVAGNKFIELALGEFLKKQPGLADELRRRAREQIARERTAPGAPRAKKRASAPHPRPPGSRPTTLIENDASSRAARLAEREARKRQLIRELTEDD
jgi:hypothetical protein